MKFKGLIEVIRTDDKENMVVSLIRGKVYVYRVPLLDRQKFLRILRINHAGAIAFLSKFERLPEMEKKEAEELTKLDKSGVVAPVPEDKGKKKTKKK
jgi:hypothetical protein